MTCRRRQLACEGSDVKKAEALYGTLGLPATKGWLQSGLARQLPMAGCRTPS